MRFDDMGLCPEILRALHEAQYEEPTPIQEKAIPILLEGRDLMGCAQTGTGKTAAFALPILNRFRNDEPGRLRALILVPTRELAIQVGRSIRQYGAHLPLRSTAIYGGVPMDPQELALRYGVDILVATPGRLIDHMWRGNIDYRDTSIVVLDEADRMLDMGFIDDVRKIVREVPVERQSMLFSATLAPEIRRLAKDLLRDPLRIEVAPPSSTAEGVEQKMVRVGSYGKRDVLEQLLHEHERDRTIIFTRTKRGAASLSGWLQGRGWRAKSIHSDKSQSERVAALEAFREGRVNILVATDIAARGLDVDGISHVINYDLPHSPDDYVHRIGRTARAGRTGTAISIVGPEDGRMVAAIENRIGQSLLPPNGASPESELAPMESGGRSPRTRGRRGGRGRGPAAASTNGHANGHGGGHSKGHASGPSNGSARPRGRGAGTGNGRPAPAGSASGAGSANGSGRANGTGEPSPSAKRRRRRRSSAGSGAAVTAAPSSGNDRKPRVTAESEGDKQKARRTRRPNGAEPAENRNLLQRVIARLGLR